MSRDPSSGAPGAARTVQPLELRRTGGIAGLDDRLSVASDGTATMSSRDGAIRRCPLPPGVLARARAIAWDTLPSAAQASGRSDLMRYVVSAGGRTAVLDADVPPPGQAAAVDTAAALFAAASACPPGQ